MKWSISLPQRGGQRLVHSGLCTHVLCWQVQSCPSCIQSWRPGPKARLFPIHCLLPSDRRLALKCPGRRLASPSSRPVPNDHAQTHFPSSHRPFSFPLFFTAGNSVGTSFRPSRAALPGARAHSLPTAAPPVPPPQATAELGNPRPGASPPPRSRCENTSTRPASCSRRRHKCGSGSTWASSSSGPGWGCRAGRGSGGWGARSGRPRARARAPDSTKGRRGSRLSATQLRRWPAAASSFPPSQALRHCRPHGCRPRCCHCRRPLCRYHPRRRPRRHLGRAASAA